MILRTVAQALALSFMLGGTAAIAQYDIRTERVQFARGAESAVVEGSITGYQTVDYRLGASAGQTMNVSMATDNGANYFNILAPGESETALFVGSSSGGQFEGVLPERGDYTVRVYLMRSAARRDEVANYRLEIAIADAAEASGGATTAASGDVPLAPEDGGPRHWEVTGVTGALNLREAASTSARAIASYASGTVLDNLGCQEAEGRVWCDVQELGGGPRGYVAAEFLTPAISPDGSAHYGEDESALRAGQGDFDATGPLPCAQAPGQPMGQCDFGVARGGGGAATVVITRPDGRTRSIYFANGTAIGADTSEADPGAFSAEREGDLTRVRIGDERYELIDAIVLGG
jgi:hypothetical protein